MSARSGGSVIFLRGDHGEGHRLAAGDVRVRRIVDGFGEERNGIAGLQTHRLEIEGHGFARVEGDLVETDDARLSVNAIAPGMDADGLEPVVVARLDDRLGLEIHGRKGIGAGIADLHVRRQIVSHGERGLPGLARGKAIDIDQGKFQLRRLLRFEPASDLLLAAGRHRHRHRTLVGDDREHPAAQRSIRGEAEFHDAAFQRLHILKSNGFSTAGSSV